MPYHGVALAFLVGVGIATAAFMYLLSTRELEQPYGYGAGYGDGETFPPGWHNRSSDDSSNRRRRRSGNGSNGPCGICHEDLCSPMRVKRLGNCGHSFHVKCIEEWGKIKRECPFCRVRF